MVKFNSNYENLVWQKVSYVRPSIVLDNYIIVIDLFNLKVNKNWDLSMCLNDGQIVQGMEPVQRIYNGGPKNYLKIQHYHLLLRSTIFSQKLKQAAATTITFKLTYLSFYQSDYSV